MPAAETLRLLHCGHYGVGKTSLSVSLAIDAARAGWAHVLRVVFPSHCTSHTYELTGLLDYFSNVSSLAYPKKFSVGDIGPVSHH